MPREIDFLVSLDRDSIAAELRRIAARLGKRSVTTREINQYGRVSAPTVVQRFGSIHNALAESGLVPRVQGRKWTNAELLQILNDVWTKTLADHGRRPRMADFRRYRVPVAAWTIADRFGTWKRALVAASQMLDSGEVPDLNVLPPARTKLSPRVRFLVFQRDLYKCRICQGSGVKLEVDHVLPVSLGGSNDMDNLQTLCVPCNRGKRNSLQ